MYFNCELQIKMLFFTSFVCLLLASNLLADDLNKKKFPKGFLFGTATAAYQIEGGWNDDDKGENIWDRAAHSIPSRIYNNQTGDIACDSYHKIDEDIRLIKELGSKHYRFSISWSRLLPNGYEHKLNPAGIKYYQNLIQKLKMNKIEPVVTMFHWDTPQPLQDIGGWPNEVLIDFYVGYATYLFMYFSTVKIWITFNEPKQICQEGYGDILKAPFVNSKGIGEYLCTHNVLKAHAKVAHLYKERFHRQNGKIGMTIDTVWAEPEDDSTVNLAAAERQLQFTFGWFANPITLGDYPQVMKDKIAERSLVQGFVESRLPTFTQEEIDYIKDTVDFLGVNYYTSVMAKEKHDNVKDELGWKADSEVTTYFKDDWETCASSWMRITPWGLRKLMNWIKTTYGDYPILITENGVSDNGSSLDDDIRIKFYQDHLSNLRDAMDDGVNIVGYTAWSLMDNFEWLSGYSEKFGIYSVDFDDPNRTRTPKKSVAYMQQVFKERCVLDDPTQCEDLY